MRMSGAISYATLFFVAGCSSDGSLDVPSNGGSAGAAGQSPVSGGSAGAAAGGAAGQAPQSGGSAGTASPSGGQPSGGASAAGAAGSVAAGTGSGGAASMDPLQFYAAVCASCHGSRGEGVMMKGPDIQHPVRDFSTWVVRNGRQGHPSYPGSVMLAYNQSSLPDVTLKAIFDWLSTPALPKPTTGAALYQDFCANCHGPTGEGGPANHDAKDQPLSKATMMVRSGHNLSDFGKRTAYMPKWSATELSDAEIGLIVTHLNSL